MGCTSLHLADDSGSFASDVSSIVQAVEGAVAIADPAVFYRSASGTEPVREWLRSLAPADRQAIGRDLAVVQFGWPVGMPLCRPLGQGLWEVRTNLPSRRTAQVMFFIHKGRIGIVHGFIKKAQRTPVADIALARQRMQEMTS